MDPLPPPLPPAHREYHPPTYNSHTLMDTTTPTPTPNSQVVPPINLQLLHTNGPPYPSPQGVPPTNLQLSLIMDPLPPAHREYHPTYNSLTLMDPSSPTLNPSPQGVPPTNLQQSHTNGHHYPHPYPKLTGSTTHQLTTLTH